jgi:hypothetical protein
MAQEAWAATQRQADTVQDIMAAGSQGETFRVAQASYPENAKLVAAAPEMLAALRHGAPVYVSTVATGADDDDSDDAAGGRGIKDAKRIAAVATQACDHEDIEAIIAEEQEAGQKWRRASEALAALHRDDPEAAEVVRRRRGLDGLGEEEALEAIATTGLVSTGRAICRESVRQLQKRGEAVLRRRAAEPATHHP